MPDRCPQDGGFIGQSGCTHPNHRHSELVTSITTAESPHVISLRDANAALNEGFYVTDQNNKRVGFGWNLKGHLDNHGYAAAKKRKEHLMYAVHAVRTAPPVSSEKEMNRIEYAKSYPECNVLVVADDGEIREVVTFYLPKKGKSHERG